MFKVWCEWDIGLNDCIFTTREVAMKYIEQAWEYMDFDEEDGPFTVQDGFDNHLLCIEELDVISE